MRYRDETLSQAKYNEKLIIESILPNVAYEVIGQAVCVMAWQGNRINRIYGTLSQMREMAQELISICEEWEE